LTVPEYYGRVIPENQNFDKGNYAGIFHFRFWNSGEWIDGTLIWIFEILI